MISKNDIIKVSEDYSKVEFKSLFSGVAIYNTNYKDIFAFKIGEFHLGVFYIKKYGTFGEETNCNVYEISTMMMKAKLKNFEIDVCF